MAGPPVPEALLGRLRPLLDKLPFIAKKPAAKGGAGDPFDDLEDQSPDSDESFEPNALPGATDAGDRVRKIDFPTLIRAFLGNTVLIAVLASLLLVVLAMALASIFAQAAPPSPPAHSKPITDEGRAAARRFILPPDPAFELSPRMEAEPRLRYTDADMKRLSPVHDPADLHRLVEQNDREIGKLLGGRP